MNTEHRCLREGGHDLGRNDAGFGLLGALIAVGISSLIALGLAGLLQHSMEAQKHTEFRGDLDSLRHQIQDAISCTATLDSTHNPTYVFGPPQTCTGDIDLWRLDPATGAPALFLASGTTIGKWAIRANCNSGGLIVQAAQQDGTGFRIDPMTGTSLDWSNSNGELFSPTNAVHPTPCPGSGATTFSKVATGGFGGVTDPGKVGQRCSSAPADHAGCNPSDPVVWPIVRLNYTVSNLSLQPVAASCNTASTNAQPWITRICTCVGPVAIGTNTVTFQYIFTHSMYSGADQCQFTYQIYGN